MIQTSYFANHRNFPDGKRLVSVSRFTPEGVEADYALELAPQPQLLSEYKEGKVSEAEFKKQYISETLDLLDPKEVAKNYKDSIFLCYEKTGDFCHRNIIAEWLRSAGENIEEVVKSIRIAVVGSRGFKDFEYFKKIMDMLTSNYRSYSFVSGGAKSGADAFIEKYGKKNNVDVTVHLPDWDKNGKSAGFIRNMDIWDDSEIGVMFWDGLSKGTAHSLDIAKKQGKKLYVVEYLTKKIYIAGGNT